MHFMHRYYSYPAEMGFADGLVAQLGAQTGHNNAAFSISGKEGRPHIPIKVLGGDGQWHPNVIVLADSGNDVTLFTGKDGAVTHLDQKARAEGSPFPVQGVAANPIKFNMTKTMIQIGDLKPIEIPLGIEDENPPQLEDTLLGREGCMERYIVVYTGDRVIFVEKETGAGCSVGCAKY